MATDDFDVSDLFSKESLVKTGIQLIPSLVGLLFGGDKKGQEAQDLQLTIAQALLGMSQQRHAADMGLRAPLFDALRERVSTQKPRMLPGSVPLTNPYRNVMKMERTPPVSAEGGPYTAARNAQRSTPASYKGTPALSGALQRVGGGPTSLGRGGGQPPQSPQSPQPPQGANPSQPWVNSPSFNPVLVQEFLGVGMTWPDIMALSEGEVNSQYLGHPRRSSLPAGPSPFDS